MQDTPARAAWQQDAGEVFFSTRRQPLRHDRPPFSPDDWPLVFPRGAWDLTPRGSLVRFIASRRVPVFYHPIEKSGCTFLKNLMWMIEWDEPYAPGPLYVHENHDMSFDRVYVDPEAGPPCPGVFFTCVREPLSRFLSAYFDKFVGTDPIFDRFRQLATNRFGFDPNPPATLQAHRKNIRRCLTFIRFYRSRQLEKPGDQHFLPQAPRLRRVRQIGGDIALLEAIDAHLRYLLADVVPDLDRMLLRLGDATHPVARPFSTEELLDPNLEADIRDLYGHDTNLYADLARRWRRRLRLAAKGTRTPLY